MNSTGETDLNPKPLERASLVVSGGSRSMLLQSRLETVVVNAYAEGQMRFGDLGLDFCIYASRIDSIIRKHLGPSPAIDRVADFVESLHGRDLYLATACAQSSLGAAENHGSDSSESAGRAWKTLESTYKGLICELVRFFYRTSFAAQDLADSMIAELYLPDRSGRSRIASYDGRSSFGTWLRVVICNRAINAQRCSASTKSTNLKHEVPDEPAWANIESNVVTKRYAGAIEDSLASACRALTARERLMLLWRYQDGLQLGQIAQLLGIHQSNVTRQLDRMKAKLRDDVAAILSGKHGLSRSAVQECLDGIVDNPRIDVSLLDFMQATDDPRLNHGFTVADRGKPAAGKQPLSHKPPHAASGLTKEA